ncbi:hypothetical protein MXMO3_01845 [Maritalea myrionectae]|uniref:Uncharacterized protein n=1 Tax=Maritalea myrionectae TaxID=454601 RepID=A0A2R4MED5_9HYPH|nr:hypothetical protein [Maritalea myrionectae]AVX04370.1 hypothetical protein MXMO3_01845 [Maritalea myrionectae]
MKHTFKKLAAFGLIAALTAPTASYSADWIESVSISMNGIDIVPIEVNSNGSEYTSIKTNSHRFIFKLRARATNGERIVAAALGTLQATNYFEAQGPGEWIKRFTGRDVGSGSLRTWEIGYDPHIPVSKLNWVGKDPVERCNALLASKRQQGSSRFSVLNQKQMTTAYAYFKLDAVAARKRKAKNNSWSISSTTQQAASMHYKVQVTCLPSSTMVDKITN